MESALTDLVSGFNAFDWVVVLIVTTSTLYGLTRGFAKEVTSFLGWIGAFVLANIFALDVSVSLNDLIDDRSIRYIVAWSTVFIAVLFFVSGVGRFLSNVFSQSGLNFGNRLLGGGFGAARGVVIAAALTLICKALIPQSEATFLDESELSNNLDVVADWLADNIDDVLNNDVSDLVDDAIDQSGML